MENNNQVVEQLAELLPDAIANEEVENVICYLLNNGADINALDNYNQTPLNYAAIRGNVDAVTILLNWTTNNSRADIEVRRTRKNKETSYRICILILS